MRFYLLSVAAMPLRPRGSIRVYVYLIFIRNTSLQALEELMGTVEQHSDEIVDCLAAAQARRRYLN